MNEKILYSKVKNYIKKKMRGAAVKVAWHIFITCHKSKKPCFCGQRYFMTKFGILSRETVRLAIKKLESAGIVSVFSHLFRKNGRFVRRNWYTFNFKNFWTWHKGSENEDFGEMNEQEKAQFDCLEKILSEGVKEETVQKKAERRSQFRKTAEKKNKFNNFPQRKYPQEYFDAMERGDFAEMARLAHIAKSGG